MNYRSRLSLLLVVLGCLAGCGSKEGSSQPALPIEVSPSSTAVADVDGKARSKAEKRLVLTNTSTPQAITLALALKKANAKVYTAYWCPHCHDQGELFGKEAFAIVAPIECAKDGQKNQVALCRAVAEKAGDDFGFPTWEINGRFYPGQQTLEQLEAIVKIDPKK